MEQKKTKPKISVIVPVYNTEQYLERCLNSLITQTWPNIEIVVVNDGSTDASGQIAEKLRDQYPEKLKYLCQDNAGQGKARNTGIRECTGDYIGFLDSDDFVEAEMYEEMVKTAIRDDADYVACGFTDFYEENEKEITIHPYVASRACSSVNDLYHDVWVSPWLHLYRADAIRTFGVTFPEGVIYEDTAFFINLIPCLKKVSCIEKAYVHHRKHKTSTMGRISLDRVLNIFPVIDAVRNWYESQGWNREFGGLCEYVCIRILLCSSVERISYLGTFTERQTAIRRTMEYIHLHYPAYRKNPEFKQGVRGLYMKMSNRMVVTMMAEGMRMKNKWKQM